MISSTLNHRLKEKKRKREFGQKEKTMKRIRCCVIGVFGSPWMQSCVKNEKLVSVWIRKEWWWKSGRQGEKSGRKRGGKKGKGKKWFWEKSFLLLFDCVFCVFPFFPCTHHTTTPHTLTLIHHTTWRIGAHHHMQAGPCAVLPFFNHNQICGLLPEYQLAACQPHSLKRERWGLSRYGLMPGHGYLMIW